MKKIFLACLVATLFMFSLSTVVFAYLPDQSAEGKALYAKDCASCHGANLKGGSGPSLISADFVKKYPDGDQLRQYIRKNKPVSAKGSYSGSEANALVAYIASVYGVKSDNVKLGSDNLANLILPAPKDGGKAAAPTKQGDAKAAASGKKLPKTASPLAAIALAGSGLLLSGAVGIRKWRSWTK